MALRRNDNPRPGLKYDAVGMANGTRVAVADLPTPDGVVRGNAYECPADGTTSVILPEVDCLAGELRNHSLYVKATVAGSLTIFLQSYAGSTFITGHSAGAVPVSVPAGQWVRVDRSQVTASIAGGFTADATRMRTLVRKDGGGTYQVSLMQWEGADSLAHSPAVPGSFFDGDTPGGAWVGANGASASTLTVPDDTPKSGADTFTLADAGDVIIGPAGLDSARLTDSGTVAADAAAAPDVATFTDGALVLMLRYDARRGRVRVDGLGFDPSITRAVVEARPAGAARFAPVRGGSVAVTAGRFARVVDDYEFTANRRTTYRVSGYAGPLEAGGPPVQTALADRDDELAQAWLKFIAAPFLNLPITLTDWDAIERQARTEEFEVKGRAEPVVVTDMHSSRRTSVQLLAADDDERDRLDHALSQGAPAFLHVPTSAPLPSMYCALGTYTWSRITRRAHRYLFNVALVEVAAPPPSVVGAAVTWQTLLDECATWQDVLATYATWQEVLG